MRGLGLGGGGEEELPEVEGRGGGGAGGSCLGNRGPGRTARRQAGRPGGRLCARHPAGPRPPFAWAEGPWSGSFLWTGVFP